jgi:hypothetical protein
MYSARASQVQLPRSQRRLMHEEGAGGARANTELIMRGSGHRVAPGGEPVCEVGYSACGDLPAEWCEGKPWYMNSADRIPRN